MGRRKNSTGSAVNIASLFMATKSVSQSATWPSASTKAATATTLATTQAATATTAKPTTKVSTTSTIYLTGNSSKNNFRFYQYLLRFFSKTVSDRKWLPHMPFLIDQEVMREIESEFEHELDVTSSHKSRMRNDVQYEMMYWYYIIESGDYPHLLKDDSSVVDYMALRDHYFKNRWNLKRLRKNRRKFICMNDILKEHSSLSADQTYKLVDTFYLEFFPNASSFESVTHRL